VISIRIGRPRDYTAAEIINSLNASGTNVKTYFTTTTIGVVVCSLRQLAGDIFVKDAATE